MTNKTISFNYNIVETGTVSRVSLFEDMVGIMETNGMVWQEAVISSNSITLGAIANLLFIRSDNPLNITLNGTNTFISNQLFLASTSATSAVITNSNSGTPVNAIIMYL